MAALAVAPRTWPLRLSACANPAHCIAIAIFAIAILAKHCHIVISRVPRQGLNAAERIKLEPRCSVCMFTTGGACKIGRAEMERNANPENPEEEEEAIAAFCVLRHFASAQSSQVFDELLWRQNVCSPESCMPLMPCHPGLPSSAALGHRLA